MLSYYDMHSQLQFWSMLLFFNIPELSCISGTDIPSLAFHMGTAGRPEAFFPGFGWNSGDKWSRKVRLGPMFFYGSLVHCRSKSTLSRCEHRGQVVVWARILSLPVDGDSCPNLLLLPGFGAGRAHCGPGTTVAPTGFWRGNRANQVVWYTYSPQYYQPA